MLIWIVASQDMQTSLLTASGLTGLICPSGAVMYMHVCTFGVMQPDWASRWL